MYSAVHHEGGGSTSWPARESRWSAPREVVVHSIHVEDVAGPRATLRVVCGKGTLRAPLAADIGAALGCGGAVERLVRTRVGPFAREEAVSWGELTTGDHGSLDAGAPGRSRLGRLARRAAR